MSRLFSQSQLPSASKAVSGSTYSVAELSEIRRNAKYFALGNLIRLGFGLPILGALNLAQTPIVFVVFGALMALHLASVISDSYRYFLVSSLIALAHSDCHVGPDGGTTHAPATCCAKPEGTIRPHFYFSPRPFETSRFYRAIGGEWAQGRVIWYDGIVRRTSKEKSEAKSFQYLDSSNVGSLIRFEASTRSAEFTHLVVGLFNLAATVVLVVRLSPVALFGAATVWFDFGLVVLQRYSRVRVMQLLSILERKAARARRA